MVSVFGVVSVCLAMPAVEAGKHQVLVEMGEMSLSSHPDPASERMSFNVTLNLTSALPGKIAYCESEKILLTLKDSKGAVCPSSELLCFIRRNPIQQATYMFARNHGCLHLTRHGLD